MNILYPSALIGVLLTFNNYAQTVLTLQPDGGGGKDALIEMRNTDPNIANGNNGNIGSFEAGAWTWSGDPGLERSLLQFDLSVIPAGAIITDARLSLYNDSTSSLNSDHSTLSGSNASVLQRITSAWDESTVTWNTQPSTVNTNEVTLQQSVYPHEDYLNIDVTAMVNDMFMNPSTSFGFMIKLINEQFYRAMIFASSDNLDCSLHPKLVITFISSNPTYFVTIKPDGSAGKDALIEMRNTDPNIANGNNGNIGSFEAGAWTWSGDPGLERSLLQFDLSVIPAGAIITDARLSLYNDSTSSLNSVHSTLSGSNASVLQRITSTWDESTVTWNTQPSTVNTNEVTLQQSVYPHEDYLNIDVTAMVNDMFMNPSTSFGFMIKLINEQFYRAMIFASSDNANCNLYPKLEVKYNLVTGINNISNPGDEIKIYPNPSNGKFAIDIYGATYEKGQAEIFTLCGQKIVSLPVPQNGHFVIDLSNQPKGIYLLQFQTAQKLLKRKIIIE